MFSCMEEETVIKKGGRPNYSTPDAVPVYELNEIYSKIGFGNAQRIYWSILTLSAFMDEIEQTLLGLMVPFLKCDGI